MRRAAVRRSAVLTAAIVVATTVTGCGGSDGVTLAVTPGTASYDTPLSITVSGLDAGSDATLQVTTVDEKKATWSAQAVFRADGAGRLSTAQAPVSGDYSGADPMGLVEVLSPGSLDAFFSLPQQWTMTVAVLVDGKDRAHTDVVRNWSAAQLGVRATDLRPADGGVYGTLFLPATTPARPTSAVVVAGGSEGGLLTSEQAATLAAHGHPALALAYFAEPGLPADLKDIPLEYFATAVSLLATQPGVDPAKVALWGTSRGSEAALLTAAYRPDIVHGVIASVPGAEAMPGLPDTTQAAWSWQGTPVVTESLDRFGSQAADRPATIPVERIDGPLLLACGTDDALWNSCQNTDVIAQRLQAQGSTRPPTVLREQGAGHGVGVLVPYIPRTATGGTQATGRTDRLGGTYEADQAGRAAAWPAVLAWLAKL